MPPRQTSLADARAAFAAQSVVITDWAGRLTEDGLAGPSAAAGWTLRDVLAHLARSAQRLAELAHQPVPGAALTLGAYVAGYAEAAQDIAQRARDEAGDPRGWLVRATEEALGATATADGAAVVRAPRGPLRLADFVLTRVIELVAHGHDLGVEPDREALHLAARALAGALAERLPGRAVELRVPPAAAVQLLEGTTHRRGTPPAVVETDPRSWVLLATGRLAWADALAAGTVVASGGRSDLSPYLPVLS